MKGWSGTRVSSGEGQTKYVPTALESQNLLGPWLPTGGCKLLCGFSKKLDIHLPAQ